MKLLASTIVGALGILSMNAFASELNEFDYLGINLQHNSYDKLNFAPNVDTAGLTPLVYDADSAATGFRGFVGHQFNRYLAVEAGVTSFGEASFAVMEKQTDSAGKTKNKTIHSGDFSTLAGDIRMIVTYPLSGSLFLKAHLGALVWDNEFSTLVQGSDGLVVQKTSDNGVSLLTGIGAGYGFNKKFAMSLDFERTDIASITTQNLSLAFIMRF
ncbi:outer membrane beta-barrel protein [Shewanella salipaludis]|uniref:Outer membrane beta-barrel protein n=1 Tax=Shewanella salipaludis TaxID=2723052 RepID=A0A972JJX9_9GAMM|nr:outer membrane beta-barrel protein [Shewanella salipaludis]NMH66593.1 outer membrane beta-barrel protein [Shewanella salipaludis]